MESDLSWKRLWILDLFSIVNKHLISIAFPTLFFPLPLDKLHHNLDSLTRQLYTPLSLYKTIYRHLLNLELVKVMLSYRFRIHVWLRWKNENPTQTVQVSSLQDPSSEYNRLFWSELMTFPTHCMSCIWNFLTKRKNSVFRLCSRLWF